MYSILTSCLSSTDARRRRRMEKENGGLFVTARGLLHGSNDPILVSEKALDKAREVAERATKEAKVWKVATETPTEEEVEDVASSSPQISSSSSGRKRPLSPSSSSKRPADFLTPEIGKKLKGRVMGSFKSPRPFERKPVLDTPPNQSIKEPATVQSINQSMPTSICPLAAHSYCFSSSPATAISRLNITSPNADSLTDSELQDIALAADCDFGDDDIFAEEFQADPSEIPTPAPEEPTSGKDMFASTPEEQQQQRSSEEAKVPGGSSLMSGGGGQQLTAEEQADIDSITSVCFSDLFNEF